MSVTDDTRGPVPRDRRAATEYLYVLPIAPGMYEVYAESGTAYTVDLLEGRCTCKDHEYRGVDCKHIRRVELALGERDLPRGIDRDALDPLLAERPAVQAQLQERGGADAD